MLTTLSEILSTEYPPLRFHVPDLLPEGLTLLWGSPKSGKSILVLQWLIAISSGGYAMGKLPCESAPVLYISLEDGHRRLQSRARSMEAPTAHNFHVATEWTAGVKAAESLERILDEELSDVQVVVIDTWVRFSTPRDTSDYAETSQILARLKRIADDRNITLVVVHHSRKSSAIEGEDFQDTALGSRGLTGAADHLLYLQRTPEAQSDAILHFRSKDADSRELALDFDTTLGSWLLRGDAAKMPRTSEQADVLDVLRDAGEPMQLKAIAESVDKKTNTVSELLRKLVKAELVTKLSYGLYTLKPSTPTETTESTESYLLTTTEDSVDSALSVGGTKDTSERRRGRKTWNSTSSKTSLSELPACSESVTR